MSEQDFLLSEEQLRHAHSIKWTNYPADTIPMWVADMDFRPAPSVLAALKARLDHGLGYEPSITETVLPLLRRKLEAQGLVDLPKAGSVSWLPGVVAGLYAAVLGTTDVGDDVLTMTPIYPPFFTAIRDHGRNVVAVPLTSRDAGWGFEIDKLEAAVTPRTKLLMLCLPHNPTGRVWTPAELQQLADFATLHKLHVVSDELHADLTLDGPFTPFAAIASVELRQRLITLTGPCKAYNTAGLGIGAMISHNPDLLKRCRQAGAGLLPHPNAMSSAMWHAALLDDGVWLSRILDYLRGNRDLLAAFLRDRLPAVRYTPPQATYLAWLDFRQTSVAADPYKLLKERGKVALAPGAYFGEGYQGFARLNFATSRQILTKALDRLATI